MEIDKVKEIYGIYDNSVCLYKGTKKQCIEALDDQYCYCYHLKIKKYEAI